MPTLAVPLLLVVLSVPGSRAEDFGGFEVVDDSGDGSSEETFDCFNGFLQCGRAWSREKKVWCLQRQDVRCPGQSEDELEHKRSHLMSVGMAWTLLGSMAFIMALFYLVHWPDHGIRRYAWNFISTSISIFTAVLIFQGINELIELVPRSYSIMIVCVDLLLLLVWCTLTNMIITAIAGTQFEKDSADRPKEVWIAADGLREDCGEEVGEEGVRQQSGEQGATSPRSFAGNKSVAVIGDREVFVRKGNLRREQREQSLWCWASLFAHLTGFSAINVGAHMQQFPVFKMNPFMTVVVVLMNQLIIMAIFQIAREGRARSRRPEGGAEELAELCNEHAEEAENDSLSLSASFLITQAMRYWLTGVLPDANGEEMPEVVHTVGSILSLYGAGLLLGVAAIILPMVVVPPYATKHDKLRRFVDTLQNQGLMTLAWCVIFATQYWALRSRALDPLGGPRSMGGRIMIALGSSFVAFIIILGLGKIEDAARAADGDFRRVNRLVKSIVNALGILAGFTWEISFKGGLTAVSNLNHHPLLTQMMLLAAIVLVIIPAWRRYVLDKVLFYRRLSAEEWSARQVSGYEQLEHEETT